MLVLLAAWTAAWPGVAAGADALLPAPGTVRVAADGNVTGITGSFAMGSSGTTGPQPVHYRFALPQKPAVHRGLEDNKLPISTIRWEKDGIKYTQIVLMTRMGEGDLMPEGKPAKDGVLMVQLVGENTTSEYTEATAAFGVQVGGREVGLELREGVAQATGTNASGMLAVIDIAAGGVAQAAGAQLRFLGHMPPGTSGAMTIKIPAAGVTGEESVTRLRDLEFDEEFRRVKRYWTDCLRTNSAPVLPVALEVPTK